MEVFVFQTKKHDLHVVSEWGISPETAGPESGA
jgi:hypothetical protein